MRENEQKQPREASFRKRECLTAAAVALFFVFTFIFYGPLGLYLENAEELWFSLKTVLTILVPVSLAVFVLILLLAWLLPRRASSFILRLIFGVTLGMYLQGTLLNINYGVLDGTSINWGEHTLYGVATLLVWAVCILAPFVLSRWEKIPIRKIMIAASLFLTAIQIPALVVERINYTPATQANLLVSTDGEFEFAKENNVIVFAMDTMDEALFQSYLEAHPDFEEELTGFVHYDNTLASGARTMIGLPSMLTGVPFDYASSYSEYIESIWADENPLSAMHEAGYDVRVYADKMYFSMDALDYVDNFAAASEKVGSYRKLAEKLYQLTAYKFAPHYLKQFFWLTTDEFAEAEGSTDRYDQNDGNFYKNLTTTGVQLSSRYDQSFHYYILNGAHTPYHLTENAEYVSETTSLEQQVEGVFKIVRELLAQMKEQGIYDSATIILTTDHGMYNVQEYSTFLYKAPDADQPLSTSHAPVSAFDIPVLLYDIIDKEMPNNVYGTDFRLLTDDTQRERHLFRNSSDSSHVVIEEYVTNSAVKDSDALQLAAKHQDQRTPDTPYTLGKVLTFDTEASGNVYAVEGFGLNTGFRTHVAGPEAKLSITLEEVPQDGFLNVRFELYPEIDRVEKAIITVNGTQCFEDVIDVAYAESGIEFRVPVEQLQIGDDKKLNICIEFPDISKDEMEIPVERRTVSFGLTSLVITHEAH